MLCVASNTLTLQTPMEIHPFYDTTNSEWVAEVGDEVFTADTLRLLQRQLPDAQIQDYYPTGYIAAREGFLAPSNRVPFVKTFTPTKNKQRRINEAVRRSREVSLRAEAKVKKTEAPAEPQPPSYEDVMTLTNTGMRTPEIAARLRVRLADVQLVKMEGYRKKDPRVKPTYKRRSFRKYPSRGWTDEDQAQLQQLVSQGLSAVKIGDIVGRSANAIIGRCHRTGVQLQGISLRGSKKATIAGWSSS